MEASKRMMCAMVMMVLLLVGSAQAACTIKNNSGKDVGIIPVSAPNVLIKVKVGAVVEVPSIYPNVIIKNLATGHKSGPTKLVDGTILVCINGIVKGTIDVYLGNILDGVLSIVTGHIIALGI